MAKKPLKKRPKTKTKKSKLPDNRARQIIAEVSKVTNLALETNKPAVVAPSPIQPQEKPERVSTNSINFENMKDPTAPPRENKIEIRLVVPNLSKQQILFISVCLFSIVVLSGLTLHYFFQRKGAEELNTPPPPTSSVEETPERNDPIPSLKPPTRPSRE